MTANKLKQDTASYGGSTRPTGHQKTAMNLTAVNKNIFIIRDPYNFDKNPNTFWLKWFLHREVEDIMK